jgi:predicted peroxiredoxin
MLVIKRFDTNQWRLLSLSVIASLIFTVYCYDHLPIKDFRAYKVNANIAEGMLVPEDALPAIIEYTWVIEKDGVKTSYVGEYPNIEGGKLVGSSSKIIRAAAEPKIHDFMIEGENDETEFFLSKENVLVVVAHDFSKSSDEGFKRIKKTTDQAIEKGYIVIGMTSETQESRASKIAEYDLNFKFYFCDAITLKTIVRANPGIFEMDKATIKQKYHWNDIDQLKL